MDILKYARTCFKTFDELPFNEVDGAILSQMAYLYLEENFANSYSDEGMTVDQLMRGELFDDMCKALPTSEELMLLVCAFVASPRYRHARIKYYRNELDARISLQFSAVVYSFGENMHCINYRGTDKSLIGWKEDIMLLMSKAAGAQMMATNYLNGVGDKLNGELIITGHSKGGHLASYAAAHCKKEVQDRITCIYNMDGPGFRKYELESPCMQAIKDRVVKFVPSKSPVGIIMLNEAEPITIKSTFKGAMQHNAISWVVEDNKFLVTKTDNHMMKKLVNNINAWAETVSDEQILLFTEVFFGILDSSDFENYDELAISPKKTIKLLTRSFKEVDPSRRKQMLKVLSDALRGVKTDKSLSDQEDLQEYGVDWEEVEYIMNEVETQLFSKDYNLFL